MTNSFRCLLAIRICEYHKALFVVYHKERVIVRARVGVQSSVMAAIGQSRDCPNAGIAMVRASVLFWMVLNHLIMMVAPACEKMIFPMEICRVW